MYRSSRKRIAATKQYSNVGWDETLFSVCLSSNYLLKVYSARQRICYSALYAIARPSHGWISQRRLKLGSRNLHHRVAP